MFDGDSWVARWVRQSLAAGFEKSDGADDLGRFVLPELLLVTTLAGDGVHEVPGFWVTSPWSAHDSLAYSY